MPDSIEKKFIGKLTRRQFLALTAAIAGGYFIGTGAHYLFEERPKVALVKVPKYSMEIKNLLKPYFNQFNLNLKGKTVLLKPNIVDFLGEDKHIITNPTIINAAIQLFGDLGANIIVAEASGLRRDINTILHYGHYKEIFNKYNVKFIDLNMDSVERVKIPSNLTGLEYFYIPKSIVDADFIVSLPKLKTHHWMGITVSLKNMFGIMPGTKYGWPKNKLHTVGVEKSILDINYTVRPDFTIIDGVYGIEGNGPIFGDNKYLGAVIMSDNLVAADTVCARLMGINPDKITYLRVASMPISSNLPVLGKANNIQIIGEDINNLKQNFKLLDEFNFLRI